MKGGEAFGVGDKCGNAAVHTVESRFAQGNRIGKFCCGYTDSYRTAVEREIWGQPYHGAPCGDGFSAGRLSGAPTGKGDVCSQAQNKPQAGIFNEFYRKLPGLRIKAVYKSA